MEQPTPPAPESNQPTSDASTPPAPPVAASQSAAPFGSSSVGAPIKPHPASKKGIVIGSLMLIVVAAIGGWLALRRPATSNTAVLPAASTARPTQISQGTSNQNLTEDLTTLNANLATESQDSTASDAALNDQTQAIAVPSN